MSDGWNETRLAVLQPWSRIARRIRSRNWRAGMMIRTVVVAGTLLLGIGAVVAQQDIAVKQDNLMRGQGKSLYGTILKMVKGEIPYDQAAIDTAIAQLEESVGKIANVFRPNPKQDVVDSTYGASQKVWKNKADFDSKIPPVAKAIAGVKGKIKDIASLKAAYTAINDKCTDCHETYRVKLK
jgi:cytochrome c556